MGRWPCPRPRTAVRSGGQMVHQTPHSLIAAGPRGFEEERLKLRAMIRNPWTATTRAPTRGVAAARHSDQLLAPGEIFRSPDNGLQYRIEQSIGAGGFGQAYRAQRLGRSSVIPSTV